MFVRFAQRRGEARNCLCLPCCCAARAFGDLVFSDYAPLAWASPPPARRRGALAARASPTGRASPLHPTKGAMLLWTPVVGGFIFLHPAHQVSLGASSQMKAQFLLIRYKVGA